MFRENHYIQSKVAHKTSVGIDFKYFQERVKKLNVYNICLLIFSDNNSNNMINARAFSTYVIMFDLISYDDYIK